MLFDCRPKVLHKHCLQFLLGVKMAPRETENNAYAKFWGDKQRTLWYVMVFLELSVALHGPSRQCYRQIRFKQFTARHIKSHSKSNLIVNLFFSLIVAFSSDTTCSVPAGQRHTLSCSVSDWRFPSKMVYKQKKNVKTKTVYGMNFCIAGYLRIKSSQTMPFGL